MPSQYHADTQAVAPVVGLLLMVAIVVILAVAVYTMVSSMEGPRGEEHLIYRDDEIVCYWNDGDHTTRCIDSTGHETCSYKASHQNKYKTPPTAECWP